MKIIVDANEARSGLADLLRGVWDDVSVKSLPVGDLRLGERVAVERKTAADFAASLADGRLFRQARRLVSAVPQALLVLEGEDGADAVAPGARRGALLAVSVGFGIPVVRTKDLRDTADTIRHMAAQESRRQARRRWREGRGGHAQSAGPAPRAAVPPEVIDLLAALPGVGTTRARALSVHLGSLADIASADARRLMAVPGIGPLTALRIVEALRGWAR